MTYKQGRKHLEFSIFKIDTTKMQCNIFLKRRGGSFEKLKSLSVSCGGKCQCRNTRRGERISPEMKFLLSNQTKKKRGQDETDCWDWGLSRSSGYCSKSTTKDLAVTIIYNFRGSASLYSLFILKTSIVRILDMIRFFLEGTFYKKGTKITPQTHILNLKSLKFQYGNSFKGQFSF